MLPNEEKKELVRQIHGLEIAYINSPNEPDVNGKCGEERLFDCLLGMMKWLNENEITDKLWEEANASA